MHSEWFLHPTEAIAHRQKTSLKGGRGLNVVTPRVSISELQEVTRDAREARTLLRPVARVLIDAAKLQQAAIAAPGTAGSGDPVSPK